VLGALTLLAAMITRNTLSHKRFRIAAKHFCQAHTSPGSGVIPRSGDLPPPPSRVPSWLLRPLRPDFLDIKPSGLVTGLRRRPSPFLVSLRCPIGHSVGGHAYHARKDHALGRTERTENPHVCWFLKGLPRSALRRQPAMTPQQTCSHFTVCRLLQRVAGFVRLLHDEWVL
jgi:hypothetical protein